MKPTIFIACTTWLPPGYEELRATTFHRAVRSWSSNLNYDGEIGLHVADDGSDSKSFQRLIVEPLNWLRGPVTFSSQDRHGVGASLNAALRQTDDTPLILHAVDDWEVIESFDLSIWADILLRNEDVGMVRFFPHPDLTGKIRRFRKFTEEEDANISKGLGGWGHYSLELDRHHFAFATRPFLAHRRFFDRYGTFLENVSACEAEQHYNETFCRETDGPKVLLALPQHWEQLYSVALSDVKP